MRDPLTRVLLVLTFVTGIVDAVCFLALGGDRETSPCVTYSESTSHG